MIIHRQLLKELLIILLEILFKKMLRTIFKSAGKMLIRAWILKIKEDHFTSMIT